MRVRYASRIVTRVLTLLVMSELPDLRLDFIKDGKGDVTGLTLNIGQTDMVLRKMPPPEPTR